MIFGIILFGIIFIFGLLMIILRKKIADKVMRNFKNKYDENEMRMPKEEYRKKAEKSFLEGGITFVILSIILLIIVIKVHS